MREDLIQLTHVKQFVIRAYLMAKCLNAELFGNLKPLNMYVCRSSSKPEK